MIRFGERVVILPIDHIPGAGFFQRHEILLTNSGQQRFQESQGFLLSEALLWQQPPTFTGALLRYQHYV